MPRYGLTWDDDDDDDDGDGDGDDYLLTDNVTPTTGRPDQAQFAPKAVVLSSSAGRYVMGVGVGVGVDITDSSADELDYSDEDGDDEDTGSDEDYENEKLGGAKNVSPSFTSRKTVTSTRYSLDSTSAAFSMAPYFSGSYFDAQKHRFLEKHAQQNYPPLRSYIDGETAPPESLRRLALVASCCQTLESNTTTTGRTTHGDDDEDDMEKLARMLKSASIINTSPNRYRRAPPSRPPVQVTQQQLTPLYITQQRLRAEQEEAAAALRSLLLNCNEAASKIIEAEEHSKMKHRKAEEQETAQREAERVAAEVQRRRIDEQNEKDQAEAMARKEAAQKKEAALTEHVTKANKLRAQLVEVQKSVAIFDASKVVSKRRLNMKKIVNGRVNTLAENIDKIRSVATEVLEAIAVARQDDAAANDQQGGNVPPEMSLGKRYLLNLLASNVIVRVQAEGFNGQRGDGFPLANMMALISVDAKDFVPVMMAHIFSVCPTAVPTLPQAASGVVSEEEFMESLGMLRLTKKGEFESFERFLSRTEGVMSLVANIMASEPSNHVLMGGHTGAVKWLFRFLALLPPAPQSPLPLITAPVLDAFLTGAGHMMAKIHTSEFEKFLIVIINDISTRLDESSVGMPSATRLRKTIRGGIDAFKQQLPSRALPELYYGANDGSGRHKVSLPSSSLVSTGNSGSAPNNPFGFAKSQSNPSPFGRPPLANDGNQSNTKSVLPAPSLIGSVSPNPFGSAGTVSVGPFGSVPLSGSDNKNPFAAANPSPAFSQPSSFGAQSTSQEFPGPAPSPSPFGGGMLSGTVQTAAGQQQQPSPFASIPSTATSPFGTASNPFGKVNASASPFGGAQSNAMPFGVVQPQASSFGVQQQFGASQSTAPFGASQSTAPFGASQSSAPFGASQSTAPFGASQPTSPFASQPTPFGSSIPPSASFGTQQQSGSFGSQQQSTPFGSQQHVSSLGPQQNSMPFSSQQQTSTFGAQQQSTDDGRPPCKFFAEGRCKFGESCRFSHSLPSSTYVNPFGGPRR